LAYSCSVFFYDHRYHLDLHSFPTRRSSDLNGSGKTTTIKMLTGLLEPNEGTAEVAGFDVWREPLAAKARFAYVPDEPNLFPKLRSEEHTSDSSHVKISYAVFCLKKKNTKRN